MPTPEANQINFYLPGSTTPYPFLTGFISDQRYYLGLYLEDTSDSGFINAQVVISKKNTTTLQVPDAFDLSIGDNYIINPEDAEAGDIIYANPDGTGKFIDNQFYTVKIKASLKNENNEIKFYFAKFGISSTYSFLYRADGGDQFSTDITDLVVLNESSVEGVVGSDIMVRCPIDFVNAIDTRIPDTVTFSFEEVNMYEYEDIVPPDAIIYYTVILPYDPSGLYTLPQTDGNQLFNDQAYFINVGASYIDGYYAESWFYYALHVIEKPIINSVTAYGLASDQSDQSGADSPAISSVMNVFMTPVLVEQVNLPSKSGNITFELSQGGVVMYKADMPESTTVSDETIMYTILKEDLDKVWTTTAPAQNSNGSYTYDVSAKIEHWSLYNDDENTVKDESSVLRQSTALTKTFTSDIVPLPSVVALNAWIAGAVDVDGSGNRTVDISNATTASGYALAPELGIVGKFSKNDFYGSGITDGFFKDLDKVDALTNHAFTVSVNGSAVPVTELHQLQGHDGKTDQEMYIELFESVANVESPNKYTSANGSFPNLPGPAGILGSAQQPIYFLIPSTGLFVQTNSVKVSVAIEPRAGETTRPAATESNTVVAVSKVNQYVMTVGTASEPRFTQSTLTVPINNPTSSEHYFTSAIFTSNLAAPNALKEVSVSTDGVFDIAVVNPNIRGDCNYQVRYKISDPNTSGSITGPISATYTIQLTDPPGLDNFSVTNFSYKTFNNDGESSFKFDVAFVTVGSRSVDGVIVYFQSTNDDEDDANDIPLDGSFTLLKDVKKSDGPTQTNVSYTLQSAPAANATLAEGVNIMDKDAVASSNKWLNFRSGKIVFKPYKLVAGVKEIQNVQLDLYVFNIPTIPVPAKITLTGGVKESYAATRATWSDVLSTYATIGSSVTANYKMYLNTDEMNPASAIENNGYTFTMTNHAAASVVTLKMQVALTAADGLVYLSKPAGIQFTAASVGVTGLISDVKRGSNDAVLRVARGDYVITPASGANVTEVKLIDNGGVASTNPTGTNVKVLTCTSTAVAVQPVGPTVNVYDLAADGYALGVERNDDLDLQYRLKAGVSYNVLSQYDSNGSPGSVVQEESTPLFLTLASPQLEYTVARKPEMQLGSTYRVMGSGAYSGRIAVNATINAKGLHAEGVQSVVFVLAQEGDATHPTASEEGRQLVIAFESSNGLTKSYMVGDNANLLPSSTDNLGATEVHELSVADVDGLVEGSTTGHTLVMGNLRSTDTSTLYLDASSGFDATLPITVVAVVATRLGTAVTFKELGPSAILSNFSVTNKLFDDAPFTLTAPTTNSDGAFMYSSSNLAVATVSGSTVTIVGLGTTTITATQAATASYASNSISATLNVTVPPVLSLGSNGVTIKYTGNADDVPASSALFIQADPRGTGSEWFAVVKDGMKSAITAYANGDSSTPFTPPDQLPVPFNNIVTTLMTNMVNMFINASTFNNPIASWDMSNVTNMNGMFGSAIKFNQPINNWNTAKSTTMHETFSNATKFNQPIGSWNTAKVVDMYAMFYSTDFNQPIDNWNTANVTTMAKMFQGATNFNQAIGSWNTAKSTNMSEMFYSATNFNQPIGSWNTAKVVDMLGMFFQATEFNQNISSWNVALVTPVPPLFRTNSALVDANMPAAFLP